jgi:hypothetical protein
MTKSILEIVNWDIERGKYIKGSGKKTSFYILTIFLDPNQYIAKVLDGSEIIATSDVICGLNATKSEGIRLLLLQRPSTTKYDFTMLHYKQYRSNNRDGSMAEGY